MLDSSRSINSVAGQNVHYTRGHNDAVLTILFVEFHWCTNANAAIGLAELLVYYLLILNNNVIK